MGTPLRLLIVEDSEDDALLVVRELERGGYDVTSERVETAEEMEVALHREPWDIVLADYTMPSFSGPAALALLQRTGLDLPFIIISGTIGEDIAVATMRLGANDYLMKGNLQRLAPAVERELGEAEVRRQSEQLDEALRVSEERYRRLFQGAAEGILVADVETKHFRHANPAICTLLGYSEEELKGMSVADLHPQEALAHVISEFEAQARGEKTLAPAIPCLRKDGTVFYADVSSAPTTIDGRPCNVGFFIDITERKRAEERIKHLNAVLRAIRGVNQLIVQEKDRDTLLQGACDILISTRGYGAAWIALMDEEGGFLSAAGAGLGDRFQSLVEMFEGGDFPQCAKGSWSESGVVLSDESACADCPLAGVEPSCIGAAIRLEYEGRVYGVLSLFVPAHLARDDEEQDLAREVAGDLAFALHSLELEADSEAAEEAIRKSAEDFRVLIEESSTGICILQDGLVRYSNPRISEGTGYSPGELMDRSFVDLVHPQDRAQAQQMVERVLSGETVQGMELRIQGREGKTIWMRFGVTRIEREGAPAVLANAVDITRQKHLEQQLVQTEKLTAIGELISGITHELNNPLSAVLGFAQLAQGQVSQGKLADYLDRIAEEAVRASAIIGNLLTFARQGEPEREPVSVNAAVAAAVDLRRYDLRVSNIEVELELSDELSPVMADHQQLVQVLVNLVNNADYAIRQQRGRGTITVRTSSFAMGKEPWVRLEVLDDGPGMPAEDLSRIFEPFFTTKEVGEGTGLGLSVSYGIVTGHGGFIYADNRPEGGARFVLELPAATSELVTIRPGPVPTLAADPARILVVEDEEAVASVFEELLTADGHRVKLASDGAQALRRLQEEQFDLVISDFKMPGMSGMDFYKRLTADHPELAGRVVFTTGDVLSVDTRQFIEQVEAPVLAKPFTIDEARRIICRKLQEMQQ